MLAAITIGQIKISGSEEDETLDANVLIQLDEIRMVKMVQNDEKKWIVEVTYIDGTTITLGAHVPEIGDAEVWTQERCSEIIDQIDSAG